MKQIIFVVTIAIVISVIQIGAVYCFISSLNGMSFCGHSGSHRDIPAWEPVMIIAGIIFSFPLGWLAMYLALPILQFWLVPIGMVANGVLWGQLLWCLVQWIKSQKERKEIS